MYLYTWVNNIAIKQNAVTDISKKKTVMWHNSSSLSVIYIYNNIVFHFITLINQCFLIKFCI